MFYSPIVVEQELLNLPKHMSSQELLTLPKHMSSPLVFSGIRIAQYLVFCVVFCTSLFVLLGFFFVLPIVLSDLLRFTASDYPFVILKHFPKGPQSKGVHIIA